MLVRGGSWWCTRVLVLSIPDRGRAKPDRRRGWSSLGHESGWTLIPQPTVWPTGVVLLPIVFDNDPGFGECPQLLTVQALVAEATVETLHEAILPRAARVNVDRLHLVVSQPLLDGLRDELRPVVGAQVFGNSMFGNGPLKPVRHVLGA